MNQQYKMEEYNNEIVQFIENNELSLGTPETGIDAHLKGVKVEWNTSRQAICIGWKNSPEDIEKLYTLISDNYGIPHKRNAGFIIIKKNPIVADFISIVNLIIDEQLVISKPNTELRGKIDFLYDNYYLVTAKDIRYGLEIARPRDRNVLGFDRIDSLITIGESVNRTVDNSYREHIVPCDFIIKEAIDMIRDKKSDTEVALMIKNLLSIVLITKEEADFLNNDLGLQTDMPPGWKVSHNPLARLKKAQIQLK